MTDKRILDWLKFRLEETEGWDSKETILSWLKEEQWVMPGERGVDYPLSGQPSSVFFPTPNLTEEERTYVLNPRR